jgi:hypothetical protein
LLSFFPHVFIFDLVIIFIFFAHSQFFK